MKKANLTICLKALAFLSILNSVIYTSPVWSQRVQKDTSSGLKCVTSFSDNSSFGLIFVGFKEIYPPRSIPVNYELYQADKYMYADPRYSARLICKADPQKFSTLKLKMGVSDDDAGNSSLMTVNIYQGGNKQYIYKDIGPGTLINTTLDLQSRKIDQPENVSIEMICNETDYRSKRCKLFLFNVNFLPNS